MTYYSQFGEDRILETLFPSDHVGQCVEVGANDGVYGSTTLWLEQRGWATILVEPNPALAAKLRSGRRGRVFACAASDRAGTATLHVAEGAPHADGVSLLATDAGAASQKIARYGFESRPVEVLVRTLDSILEEADARPGIDFVSIDVEGHELSVLKGWDLARWRPRILLLEDNAEGTDRAIAQYLDQQGYVPFRRTGVNDWYARADDAALASPAARDEYARDIAAVRAAHRRRAPIRLARRIPGLVAAVRWIRSR